MVLLLSQLSADFKLAYIYLHLLLAWRVSVPYTHVQIDNCQRLRGNGRTPIFPPYTLLINEGDCYILLQFLLQYYGLYAGWYFCLKSDI